MGYGNWEFGAMNRRLRQFARNTKGATAIEYGLIVSLIVLAMVGALTLVANSTIGMWNDVSENVTEAGRS